MRDLNNPRILEALRSSWDTKPLARQWEAHPDGRPLMWDVHKRRIRRALRRYHFARYRRTRAVFVAIGYGLAALAAGVGILAVGAFLAGPSAGLVALALVGFAIVFGPLFLRDVYRRARDENPPRPPSQPT